MIYGMGLWTSARCVVLSLVVIRMAIELKYRNTPQIHTDTYHTYISKDKDVKTLVLEKLPFSFNFP